MAASAKIVCIYISSVHLLRCHGGQHLQAVLVYPRLNLSGPLLPRGPFRAPLNGTQSSPTCGQFGYIGTRWSSEVDPRPSMLSSTTLGESPTHGIEEVPASRILCLCKRPRVLLHFLNEIRGVPLRAPLLHCFKKNQVVVMKRYG